MSILCETRLTFFAVLAEPARAVGPGLDWFFVRPPAGFGQVARTGEVADSYRVGDDILLVDAEGRSNIADADFADAVVREIEEPAHRRTRFTVAY